MAGELGYTVGSIYTSLTGFYTESGAGQVQLCALAKVLVLCGFALWDFGMSMDYKVELGADMMPRNEWLATVQHLRTVKVSLDCKRRPAKDLLAPPQLPTAPKARLPQSTGVEAMKDAV